MNYPVTGRNKSYNKIARLVAQFPTLAKFLKTVALINLLQHLLQLMLLSRHLVIALPVTITLIK